MVYSPKLGEDRTTKVWPIAEAPQSLTVATAENMAMEIDTGNRPDAQFGDNLNPGFQPGPMQEPTLDVNKVLSHHQTPGAGSRYWGMQALKGVAKGLMNAAGYVSGSGSDQDFAHLVQQLQCNLQTCQYQMAQLQEQNRRLSQQLAVTKTHLRESNTQRRTLLTKNRELETLRQELHSQMFTKGMNKNPQQVDDYYVKGFDRLRYSIEDRIGGLAFDNAEQALTETGAAQLLKYLRQLGPHGENSCEAFRSLLSHLYEDDEFRILLVRHVVALFLLHRIFEPFVFGIQPKISNLLCRIKDDLKYNGNQPTEPIRK